MADDLREALAALKIAGVIERIGDYAKNIAKRVPMLTNAPHHRTRSPSCRRWHASLSGWSTRAERLCRARCRTRAIDGGRRDVRSMTSTTACSARC
jgi:hypothetical protein